MHNSGAEQRSETRSGVPIYNGCAAGFREWEFKVMTRVNACEAEKDEAIRNQKLVELASKIVDALTEEALKIALDMGTTEVLMPGGIKKLVGKIEVQIMEFKEEEARELYHWGAKLRGPLSRAPGESMSAYIARRRRWEAHTNHSSLVVLLMHIYIYIYMYIFPYRA